MAMDSQTYLALVMNRLSMPKLVMKILTGKVKVRGIRKLRILQKIIDLLNESN